MRMHAMEKPGAGKPIEGGVERRKDSFFFFRNPYCMYGLLAKYANYLRIDR